MKKNSSQYEQLSAINQDLIEEYASWCAERIAEAYAFAGIQMEAHECIDVATLEATPFVFRRPH